MRHVLCSQSYLFGCCQGESLFGHISFGEFVPQRGPAGSLIPFLGRNKKSDFFFSKGILSYGLSLHYSLLCQICTADNCTNLLIFALYAFVCISLSCLNFVVNSGAYYWKRRIRMMGPTESDANICVFPTFASCLSSSAELKPEYRVQRAPT